MAKMNIEDQRVLSQDDLLSDKIFVPSSDTSKPAGLGERPAAFKTSDLIAAAVTKFLLDKEVIPFVKINSNIWNVIASPRIIVDLETDANAYVTDGAINGRYFEAYVQQPAKGGQTFYIDDQRVKINRTGDTLVIGRYIGNKLNLHTDASAAANKPILISQSGDLTVLIGQTVAISALFDDSANQWRVYKNTRLIEGSSGSGLTFYADEPASYEFEAINEYGATRSAPISIKIGEAQIPKMITQPANIEVNAGGTTLLKPAVSGVPTPEVTLQKQTGTDNGQPVYIDVIVVPGSGYNLNVIDTATYRYKLVNEIPGQESEPVFSQPFIVKAKKQAQAAPTNPVSNSVNHTFDFTYAAGLTQPSLYEYTKDGGQTVADLPNDDKPITLPDLDYAVGLVGVRVKGTTTHDASDWLFNEDPLYSSIVEKDLVLGTAVDDVDGFSRYLPNKKVNAIDAGFYLQMDANDQNPNAHHSFLGLKSTNEVGGYASLSVGFGLDYGGNNALIVIENGVATTKGDIIILPGSKVRMFEGRKVQVKTSGSNTWNDIYTFTTAISGTVYVEADVQDGRLILNPREFGFRTV